MAARNREVYRKEIGGVYGPKIYQSTEQEGEVGGGDKEEEEEAEV
jgi:hypothetical protein